MTLGKITPILRILDEPRALSFYVEFLGFKVGWRHRFRPDLPLYMEVSREGCVLHLSEHEGDCSQGAAVRIEASDIDRLHAELSDKEYGDARPTIEAMPWGSREMSIRDPFGNRLTFTSTTPSAADPSFKVERD